MKNLNGKRLGMVFRMRMAFFKSNLKILWGPAGLAVAVVVINYFTEGRSWADQVTHSLGLIMMLSFLFAVATGFSAFLMRNEEGQGIVLPASYLEKYLGVWLASLVQGLVYWAEATLVASFLLLCTGTVQTGQVPVSEFLRAASMLMGSKSLLITALSSAVVLSVIVANKQDTAMWPIMMWPIIRIWLLFGVVLILIKHVAGAYGAFHDLLSGLLMGMISVLYFILGYYQFRSVCLKLKLE